jgi:PilZ domain
MFVTLVHDQTDHEYETLIERRRGLRVSQHRPVKIFDTTADRYIAGRTTDVSSSGLQIQVPVWAPVMEGNTLAVHIGSGAGSPLVQRRSMIPARVVWVGPRDMSGRSFVTVGIEFLASVSAHLAAA